MKCKRFVLSLNSPFQLIFLLLVNVSSHLLLAFYFFFYNKCISLVLPPPGPSGSENPPESSTVDNSFSEQEPVQNEKSPLSESIDVKPSEMSLPLPLSIGTEDHQMLLPVTGNQSPSSETLLRSTVTGYSEPQFIFLQQLY